MKGYGFPHFGNKERMCDFEFLIDTTQHFNDLNLELQDKGKFIHKLNDIIQHLLQNNVSHFPNLEK